MQLTEKEKLLLKDMMDHEEICIEKYAEYAAQAHDSQLSDLFSELGSVEQEHLDTLTQINSGTVPSMPQGGGQEEMPVFTETYTEDSPEKYNDKYLCSDALSTEKQVSSLYNTAIFEFADSNAREVLNHIQKEEQEHGDKIFKYMSANNMYDTQG